MFSSSLFAQMIDSPVASVELVKREVITKKSFNQKVRDFRVLAQQTGQALNSLSDKDILNLMLREMLILQGAEKYNVKVPLSKIDSSIQQILQMNSQQYGRVFTEKDIEQQYGMPIMDVKKALQKQEIIKLFVQKKRPNFQKNVGEPTKKEIASSFRMLVNTGQLNRPAFANIAHIFVNTQDADEATKKIARNTLEKARKDILSSKITFAEAAKMYSEDSRSKYKGGDLGYAPYGDPSLVALYGAEQAEEIFYLPINKVSEVIQSQVGYHLILVKERTEAGIPKLTDEIAPGSGITYKDQIVERLKMQKLEEAFRVALDEIYNDLKEDADIVIYDKDLK